MAWNEPGKGKDPWGQRPGGDQGQPDLDDIVRNLKNKLSSLFGGSPGGPSDGNGAVIGLVVVIALVGWLLSGFYVVDSQERAVELRFGKYTETTMPGLHWHLPWPIETRELANVSKVRSYEHKTEMLTSDENLVEIDMAVQYRLNPDGVKDFLFNIRRPDDTLQEVSESAIRETVGKSELENVLTGTQRQLIIDETKVLIQSTVDSYESGINVESVNLQQVQLPERVKEAADDVNKAREDKETRINEAQAYANDIIPRARGQAARIMEAAKGYRDRVVADARGDTRRFLQVVTEYRDAPDVTRERLYLDTMQEVFGRSNKILVDSESTGNMIYLPVEKLLEKRRSGESGKLAPTDQASGQSESSTNDGQSGNKSRDGYRTRGNY